MLAFYRDQPQPNTLTATQTELADDDPQAKGTKERNDEEFF